MTHSVYAKYVKKSDTQKIHQVEKHYNEIKKKLEFGFVICVNKKRKGKMMSDAKQKHFFLLEN